MQRVFKESTNCRSCGSDTIDHKEHGKYATNKGAYYQEFFCFRDIILINMALNKGRYF